MSKETNSDMLQRLNVDAVLWAREFMLLFGENKDKIDDELMLTWFANSIMAGFTEGIKKAKKEGDIMHYMILKDKKIRYLCNQICGVTDGKYTNDYFKVTCKKCKKELDKYNPNINKKKDDNK